ncbi:MAG: hypothetical protein PHY42_01915 [Bacilli bacterium]|nr:hypothetical protein [Bacilli bacterium]
MKKTKTPPKKNQANDDKILEYYELKQEAVRELASALKETEEESQSKTKDKPAIDPYKIDKLSKIPTWIKAFFVKYWTAGAICFFFFWGLGYYISSMENLILITALATGLIIDFLVTPAFLHFESDKKEYHKYAMVPVSSKKIWTLLINIPIAFIEVYGVVMIYAFINQAYVNSQGLEEGTVTLAVEPLLYGLFFLVIDLLLLFFKNMIIGMIQNVRNTTKK